MTLDVFNNNIPKDDLNFFLTSPHVYKVVPSGLDESLVIPNTMLQIQNDDRLRPDSRKNLTERDIKEIVVISHHIYLLKAVYILSYVDLGLRDYHYYLTSVSLDDFSKLKKCSNQS